MRQAGGIASAREWFLRDGSGKPVLPIDDEAIYGFGTLIRESESALLRLFSQGLLSGTTHTCLGQEICQMSVVRALNDPADIVLSNHRNHGHFLTYTGDFLGLIAEIMGRECGACGGIGGSQHLAVRGFHSNGVQGGMTAIGAGHGLGLKMQDSTGIVAAIIGDGTLGQGLLYESLNLAGTWKAPVLFVVEHNRIAQTTLTANTTAGTVEGRAEAFGIPHWRLDDSAPGFLADVEAVTQEVRRSRRPGFLIIDAKRLGPHSKGDDLREAEEMEAIRQRDPLERIGRNLAPELKSEIRQQAREFVDEICERAMQSPPASQLVAHRSIFVHAGKPVLDETALPESPNVRGDLNNALRSLLQSSDEVILLGEDMHDPYGGAFKVTQGLSTEYPERVLSTPISEAGVVGAGIGLAMHGYLPVVEIMFADFVTLAFDQICNHAVKFPGMFAESQIPLVIRTPAGGRRGYGPTHSQNPENLLCAVPGLTVLFPSARHAPGQMLRDAVLRWPYPTVFLEHKLVYGAAVNAAGYRVVESHPEDAGAGLFPTLVRGSSEPDVTLVTYGGMVDIVEAAAGELEAEELGVEIVLPSMLAPLPGRTLTGLLKNRDRVVVVEETHLGYGFGSELGTALLEAGFRGGFARVGTAPVPIPAARSLELLVMPDQRRIRDAVLESFAL